MLGVMLVEKWLVMIKKSKKSKKKKVKPSPELMEWFDFILLYLIRKVKK